MLKMTSLLRIEKIPIKMLSITISFQIQSYKNRQNLKLNSQEILMKFTKIKV